jgi:hypothetical protein
MDEITIITNNQPRELFSLCDLPEKARGDFEYIEGEDQYSPRLFKYRGAWYDTNEFMRVPDNCQFDTMRGWDGYQSDSFFSGILVRYARDERGELDSDQVIVGRYYS